MIYRHIKKWVRQLFFRFLQKFLRQSTKRNCLFHQLLIQTGNFQHSCSFFCNFMTAASIFPADTDNSVHFDYLLVLTKGIRLLSLDNYIIEEKG